MRNSESISHIALGTAQKQLHIPLDEIIEIFNDNLFDDNENPPKIANHDFRTLLNIDTGESFFTMNT